MDALTNTREPLHLVDDLSASVAKPTWDSEQLRLTEAYWRAAKIQDIQHHARTTGDTGDDSRRPSWPMIVLRSPKGWTGPKIVDGLPVEGTFRSHQVPLLVNDSHPENVAQLQAWMTTYRPEELFDQAGRLVPELAALAPQGNRRMPEIRGWTWAGGA